MEQITNFITSIKKEYSYLLYSTKCNRFGEERDLGYPRCCQISAHLVSAFLTAHGYECKCQFCFNYRILHFWSLYKNIVIDFTALQFDLTDEDDNKFSNHLFDEKEFYNRINDVKIVYDVLEHRRYVTGPFDVEEVDKLLALEYAKRYDFSKEGFIEYANDTIPKIIEEMKSL